jgi:DNA-binding response OmpR family regulator
VGTVTDIKSEQEREALPDGLIDAKILILDDVSFYNSLVNQTLQMHSFRGTSDFVVDIQSALEKLNQSCKEKHLYDMLITDLHLPNGVLATDLVAKLRASKVYGNIPIVLVTTEDKSDLVIKSFEKGIDTYVIKPIEEDDLYNKIVFAWKKRNPGKS